MSTTFPEKLRKEFGFEGVDLYWLTDTDTGPKSIDPKRIDFEMMRALIAAGADIFRLNMSHGDHEKAAAIIRNARQAADEEGRFIPLFMDLRGPKLRVGKMEKDEATLAEGGEFTITTRPVAGNAAIVSTDYPHIAADCRAGPRRAAPAGRRDDGLALAGVERPLDEIAVRRHR